MDHDIDALLNPRSIAIVGASAEPGKRGYRAVEILLRDGYTGEIVPINPKEKSILGLRCYAAIDDMPNPVDAALVCTPARMLPEIIEACGRKGIRGVIVVSGGFSETGAAGRMLEMQSTEAARRCGVRLIGPNMNGIFSKRHSCNLSTWKDVPRGDIAVLSNSANMAHWLLTKAWASGGSGFSTMLSVGNQADVQFHDYIASLAEDAGTRAIVAYVEGFRCGREFHQAARTVTPRKPVVVYKAGRNAAGARMAQSHSGSLAGDYAVSRGVLRQAGVTLVAHAEALLPVAEALTVLPPMRTRNVAIISEGGGPITIAAEALTGRGMVLPQLSAAAQDKIRRIIPRSTTVSNPVDIAVLTDPSARNYGLCARAILEDAGIDALLFVGWFGAYGRRSPAAAAEEMQISHDLCQWMLEFGKPIVVQSHYASVRTPALDALRAGGVPVHHDFALAVECLVAAADYGQAVRRLAQAALMPRSPSRAAPQTAIAAAGVKRRVLSEPEARALLAAQGIAMPSCIVAREPGELPSVASFGGCALAMKVVSPDIPHKTDAGGVRLNITDDAQMRKAMADILKNVHAHAPQANVDGVMITPMAEPGIEVIVGVADDLQFGPVVMFGLGGIFVEVLKDVVFRALPLSHDDALEMLDEIRGQAMLSGTRGLPPVDRAALVELLLAVSSFCEKHPQVVEIDLNPVIAHARGYSIVDARIVVTC